VTTVDDPFGLLFEELKPAPRRSLRPIAPWPPEDATLALSVSVYGEPKPAGSKTSWAPENEKVKRRDGKPEPIHYFDEGSGRWKILVRTVDSSGTEGTRWRKFVAKTVREVWGADPIAESALAMEITFVLGRKKGHMGTGKNAGQVKMSAPIAPIVRPDTLKLARAVEDALTETLYDDDSRIVDQRHRKIYAETGEEEHIEIRLWRLPTTFVDTQTL
jgi:Holliday junction resolvase RusA-like endonuclease